MADPEPDLDGYLARVVGAPQATGQHLARALLLEQAVVLEYGINQVLAVELAVNDRASDHLVEQVFSRIGVDVRLAWLEELLTRYDLVDEWPFLMPVLREVFATRNRLAHGWVESTPDGAFQLVSYNRGKVRERVLSAAGLGWLVWQAQVARTELLQVWVRLLPDVDDWFEGEPPW